MRLNPELVRFVLSGGAAAAANVVSRILFSQVMPYSSAIILAYGVGMLTAYLLMSRFVFSASGRRTCDEAWRFALVNAVAAAQVWAVSIALDRWGLPAIGWQWQTPTAAHAIGVGSTVVTSYLMHRLFTFRPAARG